MPLHYRSIRKAVIVGVIGLPVLGLAAGGNVARAADGEAPATLEVHYQGNALTVNLRDAPLQRVLQHISEQTGVRFFGDVKGKTVSNRFRDLPVEQAVNRLLGGYNFAAFFASTGSEPGLSSPMARLTEVWIMSERGATDRTTPPNRPPPLPARRVKRPVPAADALRQAFELERRNRGDDGALEQPVESDPFLQDDPFAREQQ